MAVAGQKKDKDLQNRGLSAFSKFYENLYNPIVIISPELIIRYLNPAAEKYYNLKRDNLIGKCCRDEFKCGLFLNNLDCPVAQVLSCGGSLHIKTPHHFGIDEGYMKVSPLKDDNGEITEICLEDYSKLIRLKNQAVKMDSRFKKIVGVAAFAIFVLDKNFIVEFANFAAEKLLEESKKNIEGKDFRSFLKDEDVINYIEGISRDVMINGRLCFYPDRLIYLGKKNVNAVELYMTKAKEDDDEKIYIYLNNKTKEIRLQDDLKKTNEFLNNLVNGSPTAIIASDCKGNIVLFNKEAEKLLGYSAEYAKENMNIRDFYAPGYIEDLMKMLRSEEHGGIGKMEAVEATFLDVNKNQIPCRLSSYLIFDKECKEEALVCIFYDLRARKLMQKELEETQMKLFQSEKMSSLGKLAAGIAHEINNPLGGVMIFAESILEDIDENDTHREDLKRIASETKRCKNIVKGLLEFSRQTDNTMTLQNINELLEQGMFLLENQAIFHNIDVVKEYDKDIPLVKCDSARLKQVFINITQNAIDAMGAEGTFTIKTIYDREKKRAEIEFSDTGCGIPKTIRQKIFDPFFSTKEVGKGTGLGLSMSYGIIKDHGGTISVKSKEGYGSTFIIDLPIEN
ncbi:MAG: PAS domain S-box protein [Deltaproteobacteria bacterium]|nr:PAS domain S-box protein [Deltaproteobacteria bacterium]